MKNEIVIYAKSFVLIKIKMDNLQKYDFSYMLIPTKRAKSFKQM